MTKRSFDTSRLLCYFPDFSYKANTFIFYAKVTERIYIKAGEGQLSRDLLVWLRQQHSSQDYSGLPAFPDGAGGRAKGQAQPQLSSPSWDPQLTALAVLYHTRVWGVRNGKQKWKKITCVETYISSFVYFVPRWGFFVFCFFGGWERSLQGPFPGWGGIQMPS